MIKSALAAVFALAAFGSLLAPYCKFPTHSTSLCSPINPCGFVCKDGYTPFPLIFPTKCVCPWPLTECNGKCGIYKACPSKGHTKRDLSAAMANCPVGQTVCGILGRAAGSWECVNTQSDLESCGGCAISATNEANDGEGQDCTAIEGVADVACVGGGCQVRKCLDGYEVSPGNNYCIPEEREKGIFTVAKDIIAAEFGA
ncbi:hypothetical protein FA13DRAFT_1890178 [Coprinellus micaceus]|uniref:Protein CPL1-like domain-containing protein n=1 Tax=Coprinellus micaceus TaxID=71717 RepID=A0A4Y7SX77_COPMI|nr:hypothetical protein FA13DRAFT_1890178 [Coprinellus micaceus]